MTISKATLLNDSFDTIMTRLQAQVTSVTTASSVSFTVQTYTSSFPDSLISSKSSYPILILEPFNVNWEEFTFKKKSAKGRFTIDIYCTNSEATDLFLDKIIDSIETYRTTLADLKMYQVQLEDTDHDSVTREGFKVHRRSCTFSFRLDFAKTSP